MREWHGSVDRGILLHFWECTGAIPKDHKDHKDQGPGATGHVLAKSRSFALECRLPFGVTFDSKIEPTQLFVDFAGKSAGRVSCWLAGPRILCTFVVPLLLRERKLRRKSRTDLCFRLLSIEVSFCKSPNLGQWGCGGT